MSKLLDRLIAAVRRPEAPATELDAALVEARREAEVAEIAVTAAEAGYRAALLGPEGKLAALDDARRAAARDRDRTVAVVGALDARVAEARDREAEDGRRERYDAARQRAADAGAALKETYPLIVTGFRDLLQEIAEADALVVAVNADLPAGAIPLEGPEAVRATPALAREVVSTDVVTLWCRAGTIEPLAPEYQARVQPDGSLPRTTAGVFAPTGGAQGGEFVQRRFRRIRYRGAVYADAPCSLATSVRLPAFGPVGPDWSPVGWNTDPAAVLAALAAPVEPPPATDAREVREAFEVVPA